MEAGVDRAVAYARERRREFLEDLKALCRIPSISSSPSHRSDVRRCAEHLREAMKSIGMGRAEIFETPGHPVVYGESLKAPGRQTVLVYGHYDVQPVDPLELWNSQPFDPEERDGRLYGRGVVDDKGQVHLHLKAIEAWLRAAGRLPVNLKMIVEGEEEIGSANLDRFLEEHRDLLACDVAVISDTSMFQKGLPSITYGLRGLVYFQVDLRGSKQDLHSGSFGGAVKNPVHALADLLGKLRDDRGRVAIPGFYDDVQPLTEDERRMWRSLPFDEESYRKEIGATHLSGEEGFSVLERTWARPTLDVCGIWGGFSGEGSKTIIPSEAHAKISMRLVPDQTPDAVAAQFEKHLAAIAPTEVEMKVTRMHGGMPFLADRSHPSFAAAERALAKAFGKDPVFIREGGSIPFVQSLYSTLKVPCLLIGFGLPDENAHAPNEWLDLDNYYRGIETIIFLYDELAGSGSA